MFKLIKQPLQRQLGRVFYAGKAESDVLSYLKDELPPKFIELLPVSKYGGENCVTLLTGSTNIGQQGASYIKTLIETAKVPICFEHIAIHPKSTPNDYIASVMRNRSAIYVDLQYDPSEKAKSLLLNSNLDLFASIVKMRSIPGFRCRFPDLNITLIMQNNSGDYSKLEYEPVPGLVQTLKFVDIRTIRRYMRFVFNYAKKHSIGKITFGHKISELPKTDGQYLDVANELLREEQFNHLEFECVDIKDLVLNLVLCPTQYELICTGDRYGTIVASVSSAVCGGASLFSSVDLGDHHAVFKPLETKLSVTDCRVLSPYGIVRSCIDLLNHLGNTDCAKIMKKELMNTMLEKKIKTEEFCGDSSGDFVICNIVNGLKCNFA